MSGCPQKQVGGLEWVRFDAEDAEHAEDAENNMNHLCVLCVLCVKNTNSNSRNCSAGVTDHAFRFDFVRLLICRSQPSGVVV